LGRERGKDYRSLLFVTINKRLLWIIYAKNFLFEIAKNSITPENFECYWFYQNSTNQKSKRMKILRTPKSILSSMRMNTSKNSYDYISSTYGQHYSLSKIQSTEFIMDAGHGEGFTIGNIIKYAQRYGKKGGKNRADLLKVCHYAIMMLYVHDHFNTEKE
jgi:hypothetical protein